MGTQSRRSSRKINASSFLKNSKLILLNAASFTLLSSCMDHTAGPPTSEAQELKGSLATLTEGTRAPGVVAAIYHNGVAEETFSWGSMDCAGEVKANASAAYEIGSISKHVTAVALLKLWEEGRVDLDSLLSDYLTDIPDTWREVTLRQLLTHTSGIPDYEKTSGYGIYETSPAPTDIYAIVEDQSLEYEPGKGWSYSNTAYVLLSLVVQEVSGMPFGDYLRERIFAPLNMEHTFMGGYGSKNQLVATGCKPREGGEGWREVKPILEASTYGAGGVLTTLNDWALWDDALSDGRLLTKEGMNELLTSHLLDGADTEYAFGIMVNEFRGLRRFMHSGETQGFSAMYWNFPDKKVGILLLTNGHDANTGLLPQKLALRAMPELNYDQIVAPPDPHPEFTQKMRHILQQLFFEDEPQDLLGKNMRFYATDDAFANNRESLGAIVASMEHFEYLRSQAVEDEEGYTRYLYRIVSNGETAYFTAGWRNGQLERFMWDEE